MNADAQEARTEFRVPSSESALLGTRNSELGTANTAQSAAEARRPDRARRCSVFALPLIFLVRLYQVTLGPFMGGHCRFLPTCSAYSIEALKTHGALRGSWLTLRRVLRCHPCGGAGHDPVPPPHP